MSSDSKILRDSYADWLMKVRSNFSRNSRESLSSEDKASSPTTAFMAAVTGVNNVLLFRLGEGSLKGTDRHHDQ